LKQVIAGVDGVEVVDTSPPGMDRGSVLIATEYSLISSGTERSAVASRGGPFSLAKRAVTDPALRAKATQRLRNQGVGASFDEARRRAARDQPLGYSATGRVIAVGADVVGFGIGQRVAAAGADYATHSEIICVPEALVTPVPEGVLSQHAAFTTLGAIALHGLRLSGATIGEGLIVVGLGLVGQLAARLAAAAGCRVYGVDPSPRRCERARDAVPDGTFTSALGDLSGAIDGDTFGAGVDSVLITAATSSPTLANDSLRFLRDRGRLIIVGDVPLHLDRTLMYRGELTVQVSRSYGPGRYDFDYEERGRDYPIGQVRWTEGRNFAAVLDLIQRKRLDVAPLITAVVPIAEAQRAYELASDRENQLAVLLSYESSASGTERPVRAPRLSLTATRTDRSQLRIALVGPGAFATSVLVPALRATPECAVIAVVARRPADARSGAMLLSANYCTGDLDEVLADPAIDALVVATQHDSHADLARRALLAGKHVFVEKPLGLTLDECAGVVAAAADSGRLCMVDFNRRFSTHAQILRREIAALTASSTLVYRVNAGQLPREHWLLDPERGGGRILGEAVHFLDLLCWMFGGEPSEVISDVHSVADPMNETVCTLVFPRGRSATLVYSAQGNADTSKEWIEVLGGGHTWTLEDFRCTRRDGKVLTKGKQSKGHEGALRHFVRAALGRAPLRVTAADGMRATRLALEIQGRSSQT